MQDEGINYHPLDVGSLVKGQTLEVEELETRLGILRSSPNWWKKVLGLKQWIDKERAKRGLPEMTMCTPGGMLHVCTDSEAAAYNRRMTRLGARRITRSHRKNIAVDMTKLTADETQLHERAIIRQAFIMSSLRSAQHRALPAPAPQERTTPAMIAGPGA